MRQPTVTTTPDPSLDVLADDCVIRPGVAPAAAVGWAARSARGWRICVGASGMLGPGSRRAVSLESPFDLASISKSFVALTAARLVARGRLTWDEELRTLLPAVKTSASSDCTLEHLLAHRSGLVAHIELFAPLRARRAVSRRHTLARIANARRSDCLGTRPNEGFPPLYSDLGYMLAGLVLERVTQQPLDKIVEAEVCAPLGLDAASARQWIRRGSTMRDIVPTEHVNWRGGSLQGVVHDENAWALAGHGMAGHAGLFGTVVSIVRLGVQLLEVHAGSSSWLPAKVLAHLLAIRPGGTLRVGFDTKAGGRSAAGTLTGPRTFGHLGFTGTSLWCDPDNGVVTTLLTNRVRPTRANMAIRQVRPEVHDALFRSAKGNPL